VDNKKTIVLVVAALVIAAIVFAIVMLTAGTPKDLQPPVNEAPSGN